MAGCSVATVPCPVANKVAINPVNGASVGAGSTGLIGTLVLNAIYETKLNLYASPGVLTFSLAFSILLGMLGGLYPAWWAVRMSPMEAIRRG